MIQELLNLSKNTPDSILIENQQIPTGMYFLIDMDGNILSVKMKEKEQSIWEEEYKTKSYYNRILSTNKAVKKGIQSCNIFSFITWQNKFLQLNTILNEIEYYYEKLKKFGNNEEKIVKAKNAMTKICEYISDNVYDYFKKEDKKKGLIPCEEKEMNKNRISIYINADDNEYQESFLAYMKNNLFLDDAYSLLINNDTVGVPSSNISYNVKKPYMKHVTRSNKISYQCSFEDCYAIYKLYDWLKNVSLKKNTLNKIIKIPVNAKSLTESDDSIKRYFRIDGEIKAGMNGSEFIIKEFSFVSNDDNELKVKNDNFLNVKLDSLPIISSFNDFLLFITEDLYENNLYNDDVSSSDTRSSSLVSHMKQYANTYKNVVKYKDISLLNNIWEKSISDFMFDYAKIAIKSSDKEAMFLQKIRKLLIIKYNLLETNLIKTGGDVMKNNLVSTYDSVKEKVESLDDNVIFSLSVDEYCFAVGQLTKYLVSQSAAKNKTFELADSILSAKTKEKIDREIQKLIKKYSHALSMKNRKLNNLISMVMGVSFEENDTLNKDMIMAGFVSNNIIYQKNDKKDMEE